jgi:hypothetical protein
LPISGKNHKSRSGKACRSQRMPEWLFYLRLAEALKEIMTKFLKYSKFCIFFKRDIAN